MPNIIPTTPHITRNGMGHILDLTHLWHRYASWTWHGWQTGSTQLHTTPYEMGDMLDLPHLSHSKLRWHTGYTTSLKKVPSNLQDPSSSHMHHHHHHQCTQTHRQIDMNPLITLPEIWSIQLSPGENKHWKWTEMRARASKSCALQMRETNEASCAQLACIHNPTWDLVDSITSGRRQALEASGTGSW